MCRAYQDLSAKVLTIETHSAPQ